MKRYSNPLKETGRNEIGMLALSKSGHDRNHIYVIIREENEYVYLADGKSKPLEKPKKKSRKHIQIIHKVQEDILEKLLNGKKIDNDEIKRAIKLYELDKA